MPFGDYDYMDFRLRDRMMESENLIILPNPSNVDSARKDILTIPIASCH
jgi:hypothetical protein